MVSSIPGFEIDVEVVEDGNAESMEESVCVVVNGQKFPLKRLLSAAIKSDEIRLSDAIHAACAAQWEAEDEAFLGSARGVTALGNGASHLAQLRNEIAGVMQAFESGESLEDFEARAAAARRIIHDEIMAARVRFMNAKESD